MIKHLLAMLMFPLMHSVDDAGGGGGGLPAGGQIADGASGGDDDKGEMSLRESISAEMEIAEKGESTPDDQLSNAARTLRSARRQAAKEQVPPKGQQQQQVSADETKAAQEREQKLQAMTPEAREAFEREEREQKEAATLEAPAGWPQADREMFAKQTPEAKRFLMRRVKELEDGFHKNNQQIAPMRRMNEELDEMFKPYDDEMRSLGISRMQAIRELVGMHHRLKQNPVEGLKYLAQVSNVDLNELNGSASAQESTALSQLRQQVTDLTSRLEQRERGQANEAMNANMAQVNAFADEKGPDGKPLRPYFDEVAKDIARRVRAAKLEGEQVTLQQAYDEAIYANPTVRAKLLSAQDAERSRKAEDERKQKAAAAAAAAAANVASEGAANVVEPNKDGSVRGDLEQAFASFGERV